MEKSLLNEVKAILKSLVLSSPERITIEKLNRDYRDVEGQFIPFRQLGYGSLEEFLRSITDTLRVFGNGPSAMVCFVANEKSVHIHDMIMKQKKSKSKGARPRSKSVSARNNVSQRNNIFNNNISQTKKKAGQQLSPFESVNRNHLTKTIQVRDIPQLLQKADYVPPPLADQILYALPQPSGIHLNTQQSLNSKCEEHVKQVSSLLNNQCYVTRPPPPLPRHQIRAVHFSTDTTPTNQIAAQNKKGSTAKAVTDHNNTNVMTNKLSEKLTMPELIKLTNPIKESSASDRFKELPKVQKPLNKMQDVSETDHNNTNKMSIKLSEELTMPELIKLTNPFKESSASDSFKKLPKEDKPLNKTEDVSKIKQTKRIFDDSVDRVEDTDEAVPSFAAKNNVFRFDFPEHTVPSGCKITPFKLSDDLLVGSCIRIFITEIHNPFKFWFHIHKDNNELDLLMYQIERYYSSLDAEDLQIPMVCLTPGQVCAACYNGLWHRAEIVAPPVNNNIKVSFMDYGTVTEVGIENIKFLVSCFGQLPAQALKGCLSNIKPRALHWSHEATTYFLTLVAELMLYAKIVEIDREQNILYMILCNTNGDEVVQINKSLVEKRYALYNEEWKAERISQNNGKRIHHPREDFPTFSMIESGEYPSFNELVNLQQRGIDYEAIYDLIIFNQSTILNKHENAPERIRNLSYFLTTSNPFRFDILLELYPTTSKAI